MRSLSESEKNYAERLVESGNKIEAIKYVRERTGMGLVEAKNYVESGFRTTKSTGPTVKQGCYVATCVYGSYDCEEVWTLRRYRDNTLGSTWYGRLFIRTYYAISPSIVKLFGKTNWFKKMWKKTLDKMVNKLQEKGVENTPYNDINW